MTTIGQLGRSNPQQIEERAQVSWNARTGGAAEQPAIINQRESSGRNNVQIQYQMYCEQCLASGQTPMSLQQYIMSIQTGTDPLVALQSGVQAGKSIGETITEFIGLFKGNKASKTPKGPTEAQQTLMNNYQTALQNGTEFKVDNLKDFVNAQFAGMKANGDTVTTTQYASYLKGLGFDSPGEAEAVISCIKTKNGNIGKKDLQNFYKTVMGNSNTISVAKLEQTLETLINNNSQVESESEIEQALSAKGYNYIEVEKDGQTIGGFQKEGEFIPMTDTDRLQQILDE